MHYHVSRKDYDTRTGDDLPAADLGIAADFAQATALTVQDSKQFRVPSADRFVLHDWSRTPCHDDSHIAGPEQKGHAVR